MDITTDWLDKATSIQGWMNDEELRWLHEIALKYNTIVEIGSWKGKSTYALCSANHAKIVTVDHFKGSSNERQSSHHEATQIDISAIFWENCGEFKNMTQLKMTSPKAAKLFEDNSIDVVFIDGNHTHRGVMTDLNAWYPKTKQMICGHDIDMIRSSLNNFFEDGAIKSVEETSIWYVLKN
jgi:hypothetical protein